VNNLQVTIYTTATCPYCRMLKDYLAEKGISFSEKLVDQDEQSKEEMIKKSKGYLGVPFVVIMKDSGEEEAIIGFDKSKMNQILGLSQ